MKRVQEKVKDIVEVRPYTSIRDFTANPSETLSNYHFTTATAELMSKWLNALAAVQPGKGNAFALAGYRGVGKSHFLATMGALAADPELRSRISDSHVSFTAERLLRRHYPVAYIRRGLKETLFEEFKSAFEGAFGASGTNAGADFASLMDAGVARSGDLPLIILIDTAFERGSRVTRDDGPELAEIAEAAAAMNVFVGVALDDDIAGADGMNSSIVRAYTIDYLDQSHLYQVVNAHIFPKNQQMQPVLKETYEYFRSVLPGFRWGEQKFAALYPLHPGILEIAPYVRLYVHDFALLGFASEAGERILGRPANSLIALDEVYDSAEAGLRKVEDLNEAFAAYDHLNAAVVGKIPVMQRLQAKLILKVLLLLSLDGQGGTANDICASVMIFDESDPAKGLKVVEELLKTFAESAPNDINRIEENGGEPRYSFKVSIKESLNKAIAESIADVPSDIVQTLLRRLLQERFSDAGFIAEDGSVQDQMECTARWRGCERRGMIVWGAPPEQAKTGPVHNLDWEVFVDLKPRSEVIDPETKTGRICWKPDELRLDEIDKLRAYYVLSTNSDLREKFSDQLRASIHSHAVAVDKILTRSFLDDGNLLIDGFDYNFTEEACAVHRLGDLFSIMLEPHFETLFPAHPKFEQQLPERDVAEIITDLYNGTKRNLPEVQSLARSFAEPLGLVSMDDGVFVPVPGDKLAELPIAAQALDLVARSSASSVSIAEVYSLLQKSPYGLVQGSAQLVLTSLVAERRIEFVTSAGDRINHRSLDLRIIWNDIAGIAEPLEMSYPLERLEHWGRAFANADGFASLDKRPDREALSTALSKWHSDWKKEAISERFAAIHTSKLNLRNWNLAARVTKAFGSAADAIESFLSEKISLEDCLERIADAFFDSDAELENCRTELASLESLLGGAKLLDEINGYLAVCETTEDSEVEDLRFRLMESVSAAAAFPGAAANLEVTHLWDKFQRSFAEHYLVRHDEIMRSGSIQNVVRDLMKSDRWWEFEVLSTLPVFGREYWNSAHELSRNAGSLGCSYQLAESLKTRPFCVCPFTLSSKDQWTTLAQTLADLVSEALESYRLIMLEMRDELVSKIQEIAAGTTDEGIVRACTDLISAISTGKNVAAFNDTELRVLVTAIGGGNSSAPKQSNSPIELVTKPKLAEPASKNVKPNADKYDKLQFVEPEDARVDSALVNS